MSDLNTPVPLPLKVGALKVLSDYAKAAYDAARAEVGETMERGDRLQVKSPIDGSKIGPISKTDPKPTAVVTDEGALLDWYGQHYPEHVGDAYVVCGSDSMVVDVLFQHAPHLLRKVRRIFPEVIGQLRSESAALGQPVGPGGEADVPGLEVRIPDAVVTCKPDPATALPAVVELVRSGALDLNTVLRPALEA